MKISILLIIKIMIICLGFQITPISSQRYADSCVKPVDQNQAQDIQSFANETIYYDLYYKSNIESFMTIGSGIIEDQNNYIGYPYPNGSSILYEGISQEKPENGENRWETIDGKTFVGQVFEQSQRYEWTCPANFYSSIENDSLKMFETSITGGFTRIRDSSHPVNHNYFVNIRLNSNLEVFAGSGEIVVHSVDLNNFKLTINLPAHFSQKHLKSESIPDIQVTNNYGPGEIHIKTYANFGYSNPKNIHRRNVLHGGNEVKTTIWDRSGHVDLDYPTFQSSDKGPRETSPKSGEESDEKSKKKKKENWTKSDIFVICGLICFIFSLVFLAMPFFVKKDNDFHLLEYYDYYQESDELH